MSFVDLRFALFFPIVVFLNFLMPARLRWIVLLISSYIFYMAWKPEYGFILFAITTLDFFSAKMIAKYNEHKNRFFWLMVSLVGNLGLLFVFKYFNFVFDSFHALIGALGSDLSMPLLNLILPIGISFHVFQSISYTIDVYMRRVAPVSHFGKFAVYVSFFPQLVAGPIERPTTLLPQFFENRPFNTELAQYGAKLMVWGFFKKLVIADNIAPLVNAAFASPLDYPGPTLAIATALFAYQIYCDFSGYTDIARGAANILGYNLVLNFDRPYVSRSIGEFWRRWHISLSHWFRDYVYIPLGGSRGTTEQTNRNLLATFLLSGLWHGANWTYVIWGGLNGMYLVIENMLSRSRINLSRHWFAIPLTFILICVTWIFFRAESVQDAVLILSRIPTGVGEFFSALSTENGIKHVVGMGQDISHLVIALLGIIVLETTDWLRTHGYIVRIFLHTKPWLRYTFYTLCGLGILLAGSFSGTHQFIYFQF